MTTCCRHPTARYACVARGVADAYALETRYEFLKLIRQPHYSLGTIGFPLMFYVLFGLSLGRGGNGPKASEYLLASYAVFGCVTAALFAFGVGVSTERASGWMLLKRAAPLPTTVYLASKVLTCMLFGGVIVSLLGVLGVTVGGVHFSVAQWAGLLAAVVFGCIPFCLIGLALGYRHPAGGRARDRQPAQPAARLRRRPVAALRDAAAVRADDRAVRAAVPPRAPGARHGGPGRRSDRPARRGAGRLRGPGLRLGRARVPAQRALSCILGRRRHADSA